MLGIVNRASTSDDSTTSSRQRRHVDYYEDAARLAQDWYQGENDTECSLDLGRGLTKHHRNISTN
jgi:Uri superfamily endonuclease